MRTKLIGDRRAASRRPIRKCFQGANLLVQRVLCAQGLRLLLLGSCLILAADAGTASAPAELPPIRLVPKPADRAVERRARTQPTVPDGVTEVPFVETASEPALNEAERERGYLLFQRPLTESVHPNTRPLEHERLATHWNVGYPAYTSLKTYRRVPELLERVTVHSSPARECQWYWLTVHVPDDAQPGLYVGNITLWDDRYSQAVEIPLALRVLGFRLQKDPQKHYSAYFYVRNRALYQGRDEAFIRQAADRDYQAMVDFGLDMLRRNGRPKAGRSSSAARLMKWTLRAGRSAPESMRR